MTGFRVIYDRDGDGGRGAYSPDVEGVFAVGRTREETEALMVEAVEAHLAYLADQGERDQPRPSA